MATIHEDIAEETLDHILNAPTLASGYAAIRKSLRNGLLDAQEVSVIGQMQRAPRRWPEPQVAAYAYVNSLIMSGSVVTTCVRVGATPGPDADREGNAGKLRNLGEHVQAIVDISQHAADEDGWLTWSEPLPAAKCTGTTFHTSDGQSGPVQAPCWLKPRSIPLEIGYTMPSRTLLHLLMDGAVARWPYDSEYVYALVNVQIAAMRNRVAANIPRRRRPAPTP